LTAANGLYEGKVLVTGGAGFIGSHLVDALVARGNDVRVVDDLSSGRRENLVSVERDVDFIEADLVDPGVAVRACDGVEVVFHVAALPGVPVSMEQPARCDRNNVGATVNLLEAAKDKGCRRFIFSSSASVYGDAGPSPQVETATPRPGSPYAASKLCCETYLKTFAEAFGLDCVSLRYFNVYGPRQPVGSSYSAVFPAFIGRMLDGREPVVYGDGLQTRSFVYVSDVVRANLLAADRASPLAGETLNIAADGCVTVLEVVQHINTALGTDIEPIHADPRPGDVRESRADVERAKTFLGFTPEVSLDAGIAPTVEFFKGSERSS